MTKCQLMQIAIYPNLDKKDVHGVVRRIVRFFSDKAVHLMMPQKEAASLGMEELGVQQIEQLPVDMALSLGGDGTLLGVCQRYGAHVVPVCGVNLGTLGFMADIELHELEKKLQKLLDGDYRIEHRLLLAGSVISGGKERFLGHAINDIVVKGGVARMLHLGLSIHESHLLDCKADGIIISSPTGSTRSTCGTTPSTAYSLSAGGPIVNPNVRALIVTPICAHTFNIRPLIIQEDDAVHVAIASIPQDIIVTFDGQVCYRLLPGDEVVVRKSEAQAEIIKFEDKDYYQILRTKLWRPAGE